MANNYFSFKEFTVYQDRCAFKVGTDGVLLGAYVDITGDRRILDIGTGTGLIALMLAQRCEAEITAIEPDQNSYEQATCNVENSKWKERIKVINTNLQDYYPASAKFDLIVSNPPFFIDSLPNPDQVKAAARHNIQMNNKDLLSGVSRLMVEGGRFQVIMPYVEGNILIAEAHGFGLYCINILKIKPLPTSEIRRMILTFSREKSKPHESFLTIEHGKRHEFTEEYKSLTKEYYLKF
ncbi:MAG: methyltransferase [Bacteroidota bacterium]